jgi:hypothetical protein
MKVKAARERRAVRVGGLVLAVLVVAAAAVAAFDASGSIDVVQQ